MLPTRKRVRIINATRSTMIGSDIRVADTMISRLVGLLGTRSIAPESGLLIFPSQGVHTFGMAFPIDVLFVDRNWRVLALYESLRPFRLTRMHWQAAGVLELPAKKIEQSMTRMQDQLACENL